MDDEYVLLLLFLVHATSKIIANVYLSLHIHFFAFNTFARESLEINFSFWSRFIRSLQVFFWFMPAHTTQFLSFLFSFSFLPFTLRSKNTYIYMNRQRAGCKALSRKVIVDLDLITSVRNAYIWHAHVRDVRQAFIKIRQLSGPCIFRIWVVKRELDSHRNFICNELPETWLVFCLHLLLQSASGSRAYLTHTYSIFRMRSSVK